MSSGPHLLHLAEVKQPFLVAKQTLAACCKKGSEKGLRALGRAGVIDSLQLSRAQIGATGEVCTRIS